MYLKKTEERLTGSYILTTHEMSELSEFTTFVKGCPTWAEVEHVEHDVVMETFIYCLMFTHVGGALNKNNGVFLS